MRRQLTVAAAEFDNQRPFPEIATHENKPEDLGNDVPLQPPVRHKAFAVDLEVSAEIFRPGLGVLVIVVGWWQGIASGDDKGGNRRKA